MSDDGPIEFTDVQMARASLILSLRQHCITQPDILRAFESVPHEAFIPRDYAEYAYREGSLPIACGQSITSPSILAAMLVALEPANSGKLLEIGTGTGYSAALLARLAKRVFTLERHQELAHIAQTNWAQLSISNIVGFHLDGLLGLAGHQPFDRILLNGAVAEVPEILLEQLADGGVLVAPIGAAGERQTVTRIERADDDFVTTEHGSVRLAALVPGKSRPL